MTNDKKQLPLPQWVILSPMARWATGPKPFSRAAEKHDPTTRTIPDDSFTIFDLFTRYQKGQPMPLGIERPIAYGDNPSHNDLDMSRISQMDLAEVHDLKKRVSDTFQALTARQKALDAAKAPVTAASPTTPETAPK